MSADYASTLLTLLQFRGFGQMDSAFRFAAIPWSRANRPPARDDARPFERKWLAAFPFSLAAAGVAAARGLDSAVLASRATECRGRLAAARLPAEGRGSGLGALLMAFLAPGDDRVPARAAAIWRLWKTDHFWFTGEDDIAMSVLHAIAPGEVEVRCRATERLYQGLHAAGYARSNTLQLAAQAGALSSLPPGKFLDRMALVGGCLRDSHWPFVRYRPVEIALLALCDGLPFSLARDFRTCERAQLALPKSPWPIEASALAALLTAQERKDVPDGLVDALVLIGAQSPLWG